MSHSQIPLSLVKEKIFPLFSEKERDLRYRNIRKAMIERDLQCLLIAGSSARFNEMNANVRYISNYADKLSTYSYVIFPVDGEPTLMLMMGVKHSTLALSWINDIRPYSTRQPIDTIVERISKLGFTEGNIGIVGLDLDFSIPWTVYNGLVNKIPKANFQDATDIFVKLRMIKSSEEIDFMFKAAELGDIAFEAEVKAIRPGVTEQQVWSVVQQSIVSNGGEAPMLILFNSGPMAGDIAGPELVDPYPSGRVLRMGDYVMTEISSKYGGYYVQSQPLICLGHPSKVIQDLFDLLVDINYQLMKRLKPGNKVDEIQNWAESTIKNAGYIPGPLFHLVGLGAPDPKLQESYEIRPGMTFVIEPSARTKDYMRGVRTGISVVVTETGSISLHKKLPDLYPIYPI